MAYATPLDMLERIGPDKLAMGATPAPHEVDTRLTEAAIRADLSDYSTEEASVAALILQRLNKALADAYAVIEGYTRPRYGVGPISPIPALLIRLQVDIAWCLLFVPPSDDQKSAYDEAVKVLRDVSRGSVSLGTVGESPTLIGSAQRMGGGVFDRCAIDDYGHV